MNGIPGLVQFEQTYTGEQFSNRNTTAESIIALRKWEPRRFCTPGKKCLEGDTETILPEDI